MRATKKSINRFTVMAILQAARANALGMTRTSSYSWGLNRAIFYAAAKRGFLRGKAGTGDSESSHEPASRSTYLLGDEQGFRDPGSEKLSFTIGGRTQTEEDFRLQVEARFGSPENFRAAWDEARRIVDGYGREILDSRRRFYEEVYKPRRDALVEKWAGKYAAKNKD
jgi:hypothetical protein